MPVVPLISKFEHYFHAVTLLKVLHVATNRTMRGLMAVNTYTSELQDHLNYRILRTTLTLARCSLLIRAPIMLLESVGSPTFICLHKRDTHEIKRD